MKEKLKKSVKPIIRIVAFILVFAFVFVFLTYTSKPGDLRNSSRIYGLYAEKKNTLDVVNIGGSATFVYYAPLQAWENHGIVSYDYAAAGVQAELYKHMIEEVLKTQSPELIVIDARAFQYRDAENDGSQPPSEFTYRTTLDGMRLSMNKIRFINENVGTRIEDDDKLSYYLDLIKYHGHGYPNKDKMKLMLGIYKEKYNGFFLEAKNQELTKCEFNTTDKRPVSEDTEKVLVDLLEYIKQIDCEFLFTVSPYLEKEEHKQTFNYVEGIIKQYGYNFLDANDYIEEMGIDYSTDFYDEKHVNILGATKYTDFLSRYMIDNYDLPDRSDDPAYAFMNDYVDEWHKDIDASKEKLSEILEDNSNE
ncbi:MAG: hypothetical protein IJ331_02610 [Ruminococcus sp.]|nr:hypothetical protein [Ruminococcus sp.]